MAILIVTPNYPSLEDPGRGAFVRRLAEGISKTEKVIVIAPRPVKRLRDLVDVFLRKTHKKNIEDKSITIYEPLYITVGATTEALKSISLRNMAKASLRTFNLIEEDVEHIIAKFVLSGGRCAREISKRFNIPFSVDVGESTLASALTPKEKEIAKDILRFSENAFCVSPRLQQEAEILGARKALLTPNDVDDDVFYVRPKDQVRHELNLDMGQRIASFVGHLTERKGIHSVINLAKHRPNVRFLLFGKGVLVECPDNVSLMGTIDRDLLAKYLCASDIFVLPTKAEGHCNAINEAISCGVPVLTSNIDDITWSFPTGAGTLVDPEDTSSLLCAFDFILSDQYLKNRDKNAFVKDKARHEKIMACI